MGRATVGDGWNSMANLIGYTPDEEADCRNAALYWDGSNSEAEATSGGRDNIPEPCKGCEYLGKCEDDPQSADYCPLPDYWKRGIEFHRVS